jgi:hypothetical protein
VRPYRQLSNADHPRQKQSVAAGFGRALALFEAIPLFALTSPALLLGPGQPQIIIEPYESDSI